MGEVEALTGYWICPELAIKFFQEVTLEGATTDHPQRQFHD